MSRALALLALTAAAASLAGCTPPGAVAQPVTGVAAEREGYRPLESGTSVDVAAPLDSVFAALARAYTAIGIAPDAVDATHHMVSRANAPIPRVFNGELASRVMYCGQRATGDAYADNGHVFANVRSQVTGDSTHAAVKTVVEGWVIPLDGATTRTLRCSSTGEIERLLSERTAAAAGKR